MAVLIETSMGDIVVDLYTDARPRCSLNFLKLCKIKYFNYHLVHTVQRNFIVQTGDPTGTGTGGESIWGVIKGEDYRYFEAESIPRLKHENVGTLSMVNNGKGYHGSQFFITTGEQLDNVDGVHTVFGEVAEGMDVLMKINEVYSDKEGKPYQDIRIYHTVVIDDPFDDPEGLVLPDRSPSPPKVITDSGRIGAEENIDDFQGKSEQEIREIVGKRESKANAQILEMVGDIPDADGRPPDNVLFVCKLNPFTTSEDLEIIFSRFGPILSCEVIKDQKTGDSLQYAFIEFENEEDCESAYFKMDNVLIDDRRIHVDFSQSMSKVKGGRRRTLSEDQASSSQKDDGLVSSKKDRGNDGYQLVFGDADTSQGDKVKKTMQRRRESSESDSERQRSVHKREERAGGRGNDTGGEDERRKERRQRKKDEQRRDDGRGRDRERNQRKDEDKKRRKYRERSRSRSRERQQYKRSRGRSRSRSRERRHRH